MRASLLMRDPEIQSVSMALLVGIASAIERESLKRYATLADTMERRGEAATAAHSGHASREERHHVDEVARDGPQASGEQVPEPGRFDWNRRPSCRAPGTRSPAARCSPRTVRSRSQSTTRSARSRSTATWPPARPIRASGHRPSDWASRSCATRRSCVAGAAKPGIASGAPRARNRSPPRPQSPRPTRCTRCWRRAKRRSRRLTARSRRFGEIGDDEAPSFETLLEGLHVRLRAPPARRRRFHRRPVHLLVAAQSRWRP